MYSCLAELRETRRDLSRRRHNLGNSRLSRASWHSSLGLTGVGSKPSYMSHSYKSSSLAPSTTYSNVSVLTT